MTVRQAQRGVTFLALLLAIALVSAVLAAGASVWSQAQRRERETQLLWVGDQFRRAIAAYARSGEVSGTYPRRLEDLLDDPRSPARRRHLRQIYPDPMTDSDDWGLLRNPQGGIVGVHSRHPGVPIKTGRFPDDYAGFAEARSYADWKFAAVALAGPARPGGPAVRATPPPAPGGVPDGATAAGSPAGVAAAAPIAAEAPARAASRSVFAPSPLRSLESLRSQYAPQARPGGDAAAATPPQPAPAPAATPDPPEPEAAPEDTAAGEAEQ